MATLLEMAADMVASQASSTSMTKDELIQTLQDVYKTLTKMEQGEAVKTEEEQAPAISKRKAFGKAKVTCMICGESMKTLSRHIRSKHEMSPKEYRSQFDIPSTQTLAARDYSESRRQMAIDRGLGENLAKARAAKKKKG